MIVSSFPDIFMKYCPERTLQFNISLKTHFANATMAKHMISEF